MAVTSSSTFNNSRTVGSGEQSTLSKSFADMIFAANPNTTAFSALATVYQSERASCSNNRSFVSAGSSSLSSNTSACKSLQGHRSAASTNNDFFDHGFGDCGGFASALDVTQWRLLQQRLPKSGEIDVPDELEHEYKEKSFYKERVSGSEKDITTSVIC
ncbi:hypothetical protein BGZ49_009557 [Haplosporangium sp. Z 27]|nr:hypothetical protein BGZ49_009557 [Haplosporangium sp. Z 27]